MDFNQVRYFLSLTDTLNFTRAAEQCFVTQPALTQAIRRLEAELGGDLIIRRGRDTKITDLGKSLHKYFEQIDQARHAIRSTAKAITSEPVAELNIGIMSTIGPRVLAQLLNDFQTKYPKLSLVLHDASSSSIAKLLLSGELDGVFCARHNSRHNSRHPQLRYIQLFDEQMGVAFPEGHEFGKLGVIPLRLIAEQRYVDRLHCEFRRDFADFFSDEKLQLDIVFRSEREDWIQTMIHDGIGVSVIPRFSVLHPELEFRAIVDPVLSRKIEFAVSDKGTKATSLGVFMNHVSNQDWSSIEMPIINAV